jgi:putative ABC transport system permease protein
MLRNYIVTAFRNIVKHKVYSLINIIGFALGISCFLLILIYIRHELSYDTYHKKADRIYRVAEIYTQSGNVQHIANSPALGAPTLRDEFPEVVNYVRFMPPATQYVISREEKDLHFYEDRFVFADASVFDVFDFELAAGDPQTCLREPNRVLLTERTAEKYFGEEDPLGQTLTLDGRFPFVITGILRDVRQTSHFKFDFLASFITLENPRMTAAYAPLLRFFFDRRGQVYSYILLSEGASAEALSRKFPDFIEKYGGELLRRLGTLNTLDPMLQPLTDIHLKSHIQREWEPNGNIQHLYIFFAIALFVLMIACFNFMNLSTARSALRAQEVSLRKVVGAERSQVMKQFLGESILLTALATALALGLTHLLLPLLNSIAYKDLKIDYVADLWTLPGLLILILLVGVLSGLYPAFILSAFHPSLVMKGSLKPGGGGKGMRMALTLLQFAISGMLILGMGVVYRQMTFVRGVDLGYDKGNVVVLPLVNESLRQRCQAYKDTILNHPEVLAVSASHTLMGKPPVTREVRPAEAGDESNMSYRLVEADLDFIRTYRMELIEGRDFSLGMGDDSSGAVVINQETVKGLGLENAVGRNLHLIKPLIPKKVIGVSKNFHLESLHFPIQPVIISQQNTEPFQYLSIRVTGRDISQTLSFLQKSWHEINPGTPFSYTFFDEDYAALYRAEESLGKLFLYFTLLALVIASLGLVGLASFIADRRSHEIGIRKVLGASVSSIVFILLKEFALLVLISIVIAWPVAFFVMNGWLQDFAYRIQIGWDLFAFSGILVLLIAISSVMFQALKAASVNPVESIRYE